jgi:gluconolactonase
MSDALAGLGTVCALGLSLSLSLTTTAAGADEKPHIERLDPRFDALVPQGAVIDRLVDGFRWVEGPAWDARSGSLFFSDVEQNTVFRWRPGEGAKPFLAPSGYSGSTPFTGREPGANGLAIDAQGRLLLCQHGDRRVVRRETDGTLTVLADRYQGKRLNSPNDLLLLDDGSILFTDPPFGLPKTFLDPAKELDFQGVYRRAASGKLELLTRSLEAPNGIGRSPGGRTLYVSNASREKSVWMAYPLDAQGRPGPGRLFFDGGALAARYPGVPDGLELDAAGNLFAAGPGGIHVLAPDGTHLGSLVFGVPTSNVEFGGDGRDLYVTSSAAVYRVRVSTRGGKGR